MKQALSVEKVQDVINFLENEKYPKEMVARSSIYKFKRKYGDGTWTVFKNTLVHNGKAVIPLEEQDDVLEKLFEDPSYSQGSPTRFFNRIKGEFEGISLATVTKFLETKRIPQLFKKPAQREITPINSKRPRALLAIDFINLTKSQHGNLGVKYLLNCIDHFSKYAFSLACKTRDSEEYTKKLRNLFRGGHAPSFLHADGEFASDELMGLCKEYNVHFIPSLPSSKWGNREVQSYAQNSDSPIATCLQRRNFY